MSGFSRYHFTETTRKSHPLFHHSTCRLQRVSDGSVCLSVSLCLCATFKFPLNTMGEKSPFAHTLSHDYPCTPCCSGDLSWPELCNIPRTCTSRKIITATVTAAMQKIKEQSTANCRVAAGRQAVTARRERERDYCITHTLNLCMNAHTHTPHGDTGKVRYVSWHVDVLLCNLSVLQDTLEQIVTRQPETKNVAVLLCKFKSN